MTGPNLSMRDRRTRTLPFVAGSAIIFLVYISINCHSRIRIQIFHLHMHTRNDSVLTIVPLSTFPGLSGEVHVYDTSGTNIVIEADSSLSFYLELRGKNDEVVCGCFPSASFWEQDRTPIQRTRNYFHTCYEIASLPLGQYSINLILLSKRYSDVSTVLKCSNYSEMQQQIKHFYKSLTQGAASPVNWEKTNFGTEFEHSYWKRYNNVSELLSSIGFSNYELPGYMHTGFNPMFDKNTSASCLAQRKTLLVGDSRILYQSMHLERFLGLKLFDMLYLNVAPYSTGPGDNMFFGLDSFFKFGLDSVVFEHLLQGGTVVMNSLLHDLIDFGDRQSTQQMRQFYGIHACGRCIGNTTYCNCQTKQNAIPRFLENISRLSKIVQECSDIPGCGTLTWISFGVKPPSEEHDYSPRGSIWLLHDILYYLESYAAKKITESGGLHLDLRKVVMTGLPAWWSDDQHYGKTVGKVDIDNSTLGTFATNALIAHVCA